MDSTESTVPVSAASRALTAAVGLIAVADTTLGAELAGPVIGWAAADSTPIRVTAVAADATGSPAIAGRGTVGSDAVALVTGLALFACAAEVASPMPPLGNEAEPADAAAERPVRPRAEGREAVEAAVEP